MKGAQRSGAALPYPQVPPKRPSNPLEAAQPPTQHSPGKGGTPPRGFLTVQEASESFPGSQAALRWPASYGPLPGQPAITAQAPRGGG